MRSPFFHFLCFTVLRFFGVDGGGTFDRAPAAAAVAVPDGASVNPVVLKRAGLTETGEAGPAAAGGVTLVAAVNWADLASVAAPGGVHEEP